MFFKRSQGETCVVCGEKIAAHDSRFVEKDVAGRVTRHRHMRCNPTAGPAHVPVRTMPSLPRAESARVEAE